MNKLLVVLLLNLMFGVASAATFEEYPDSKKTPGDYNTQFNKDKLCSHEVHTGDFRDVSQSKAKAVYASYGINYADHKNYELDHFIPLSLGGSNKTTNLWPEPHHPKHGHGSLDKDKAEWNLLLRVCHNEITLKDAQKIITTGWVQYFEKMPKKKKHK